MATITPIAANFRLSTGAGLASGTASVAIAPFQWLYRVVADGKLGLAVNSSAEAAAFVGISITSADPDDPVAYVPVTVGTLTTYIKSATADFVKGSTYIVGDTAGTIMLASDAGASDYVTIVGVASSTTELQCQNSQTEIVL